VGNSRIQQYELPQSPIFEEILSMSFVYGHPLQVLKEWVRRVNAIDAEAVLALYSDDAILLPTFSQQIRSSRQDIKAYFETLAGHKRVVVKVHESSVVVQSLSGQFHSIAGTYSWTFEKDDEVREFEARFTYVMDLARDGPILHHHSSVMPESP